MARIEGWKWTDSVYYSIITGSTIGFGDFFPKTPLGRTWGIFFIPLAVAATGDVLGNVASSLLERRQSKVFKSLMNRELSIDNLLAMDEDGNGNVSREEYVRFMLTEMGMVDSEEFDELYEQFARLDADGGGYLDKRDLHIMAMHRSGTSAS
jgi:potassium channel subfamily K